MTLILKENKRQIIIMLIAIIFLSLSFFRYIPDNGDKYWMGLKIYQYIMIAFLILNIISILGPLKSLKNSLSLMLTWSISYSLVEIIFVNTFYFLPVYKETFWDNFKTFFIQTSYQFIGIIILLSFFYNNKSEWRESFLKAGNMKEGTTVLGYKEPVPWYMVVMRFSFAVIIIFVILLTVQKLWPAYSNKNFINYLPVLLGTVTNCLVEEILNRGIFLGVFLRDMSKRKANLLQAVIFGLLHWPSYTLLHYLMKVVIFTFLGWFFGRASMETKGILASTIMHSVLIACLYASMFIFQINGFNYFK
jgi:membrane protease YdiL (CAAX protease family)